MKYLTGLAGAGVLTILFVPLLVLKSVMLCFMLAAAAFVVNFFRDPDRRTPAGANVVVSPADGRVVQIKEVENAEYLGGPALQVSVFMSPLDVHVNRIPIDGRVGYFKHIDGEFLVAFDDKSSERNERTHIGIERPGYKVLFKQIAGTVARRIVAELKQGQEVRMGDRFGMIKFGSRVDVLVPKGSALAVRLNERVVAGETVLARYDVLASNNAR
jgi:phosphatidylserine decarboxylase